MMNNKFVVAIKANGKVLRELKDVVLLPFGSEFSVLVKNLNSRRAKFTLHIDGVDALDGQEIIVNANSDVEIKRFIRNGNMNEGNAFKFIERTKAIEDGPRGVKIEDGLVRVEFWYERQIDAIQWQKCLSRDTWKTMPYYDDPWKTSIYGIAQGSSGQLMNNVSTNSALRSSVQSSEAKYCADINDVGITVPGSKVEQSFSPVYGFIAESTSDVIVLRLAGVLDEKVVKTPVTVKAKPKCITCGRLNKATSKFCSSCGTALELL